MNKTLPTLLIAAAAAFVTVLAPVPTFADGRDDALEQNRDGNPDQTTRDRYQTAVDVANDSHTKNLALCDKMLPTDKAECTRQANELYDSDMAKASDMLHRPR